MKKNIITQQPVSLVVMPGVGAHIQQKGKQKSVYFGMSEEDLTADFVFPEQKFEPQDFNGRQVYAVQFDGILASFYADGDVLRGLEIQTPGTHVSLMGKTTRIGDHARQVLAHFGRGFAFDKYPNNLPVYPDIKEFISYDELGLTFGLSFDDRVALISILALDDALLHNNLWVDTTLLNPELLKALNGQSGE
ncbi:MAG: hypothetical protein IGS03_08190 [Candidatus Sericytochromatia bacterium]|nr:hypothetical protein [Candidatus Sericytochromatia bacterium]